MSQHLTEPPVAAGPNAKVFVSYSRKDLPFAQMLATALIYRRAKDARCSG